MPQCDSINFFPVVGPYTLQRGLLGFGGHYDVEAGHVAVITASGKYIATLDPGRHGLGDFPKNANLQASLIDIRRQQLDFRSTGEFAIQEFDMYGNKVLAKVKIHLIIYYKIQSGNARILVESNLNPVQEVCNEVGYAVRTAIEVSTFDEFRTKGDDLADRVEHVLRLKNIVQRTGITIAGITPLVLAPADRFSETVIRETITRRPIDIIWWLDHHPDLVKELISKRADYLLQIGLDPASFLERPQLIQEDPFLRSFVVKGMRLNPEQPPLPPSVPTDVVPAFKPTPNAPDESGPPAEPPKTPISADRIDQEWSALESKDWTVDGQPGLRGERALSDGSFNFDIRVLLANGQPLRVHLHLPVGYEQGWPPTRTVYLQEAHVEFPPVDPDKWKSGQTLSQLTEEVLNYYQ